AAGAGRLPPDGGGAEPGAVPGHVRLGGRHRLGPPVVARALAGLLGRPDRRRLAGRLGLLAGRAADGARAAPGPGRGAGPDGPAAEVKPSSDTDVVCNRSRWTTCCRWTSTPRSGPSTSSRTGATSTATAAAA